MNELPGCSKNKCSDYETSAESCIAANLSTAPGDNATKEIANLRSAMQKGFRKLEFEVQLAGETLKFKSYTSNLNFFYQQMNILEEMHDGLARLLHADATQIGKRMLRSKMQEMLEKK